MLQESGKGFGKGVLRKKSLHTVRQKKRTKFRLCASFLILYRN